jgi:anti-sigma regulatory factor (Ser/Thr protein kinase)
MWGTSLILAKTSPDVPQTRYLTWLPIARLAHVHMQNLLAMDANREVSPVSTYASRVPIKHACSCPPHLLGCLALRKDSSSATIARQFINIALNSGGYGAQADDLTLITSELVTNSVVHARSAATELIRVRLLLTGSALRLEVHDADATVPIPRLVRADDEMGRGLHIVAALTNRQGSYPSAAGKCVWCEVELKSENDDARR